MYLELFSLPLELFGHSTQAGGLVNGLTHPVFGPDHLLAMVAVGVLSVQLGGKAIWKVPLAFVILMLVGGLIALSGIEMGGVELGIMLSVIALGIALAMDKNLQIGWAMGFVGFFAVFHGHAHGTEMPDLARPELYAIGFIAATAGLHIFGVLIGEISKRLINGATILRHVGSVVAGIGIAMLLEL